MCAYSADLNFRLAAPHTAATSLPMATFKNVSASACMQSSQLAFLPAVNLMCCFIVFMPLQHTPMQSLRLIKVKTSLLPPFFFYKHQLFGGRFATRTATWRSPPWSGYTWEAPGADCWFFFFFFLHFGHMPDCPPEFELTKPMKKVFKKIFGWWNSQEHG